MPTDDQPPQDGFVRGITNGFFILFSYMGGIGRIAYWLGLLVVIALLSGAMASFAATMTPTGAKDSGFALPLLMLALWIFSALTVKRLRHAGFAGWQYFVLTAGPVLLIGVGLELIGLFWPFVLLGTVLLVAVPGLYPGKSSQSAG